MVYNPIKLDILNAAAEGSTVTIDSLLEQKALTKSTKIPLNKIVGGGELTAKGLTVQMHAFTESARTAIEGNGGETQSGACGAHVLRPAVTRATVTSMAS